MGVCTDGTNLSQQLLSTFNHVLGESIFRKVNQFGVFCQGCDLERRTA